MFGLQSRSGRTSVKRGATNVVRLLFLSLVTFIVLPQLAVHATNTSALFFNINASDPGSYSSSRPTQWNDLSSTGRDGTIIGSSGLTYNASSSALQFPGGANSTYSDGYVDMGSGFNNFGNGITIEFEGHFGQANQAWERIFDFGNGAASDNIWVGVFGEPWTSTAELAVEVFHDNLGKGRCISTSQALLPANQFAKYVITLDGSKCRMYKNGVEIPTSIGQCYYSYMDCTSPTLGSAYPHLPLNVVRQNNYIGRSNWGGDAAFDGAIKYVRIYTAALTGDDVEQNAQTYTLTYADTDAGNGTAPASRTGNGLMSLDGNTGSLTRNGYTFDGWATSPGQTTPISGSFNLVSNSTLHPVWTPNTLTVTYDTHGGSAITAGSTVSDGTIDNSPGTPTRDGFVFAGWFTASSGGSAITFPYSHQQLSDFTLHAQWTEQPNNQVTPTPPADAATPAQTTASDNAAITNSPKSKSRSVQQKTESGLPKTGTDSSELLLFAFACIVGGACLLLQRRQLVH